jgi:hypothetical protein
MNVHTFKQHNVTFDINVTLNVHTFKQHNVTIDIYVTYECMYILLNNTM